MRFNSIYTIFYLIAFLFLTLSYSEGALYNGEDIAFNNVGILTDSIQNSNNLRTNNSDFQIVHSHDFENNTLGPYNSDEHNRDWDRSYWNRPGHPHIVNFNGRKVARNLYEQGKWGARESGSDFGGRLAPISDEIYYTYQVFFERDFHWGRAVKFPGFRMTPAMTAGGGSTNNGGSIIRFQSDSNGRLRWYVYHHRMQTNFGDNLGWGGFQLLTNQWYTITFRVVLNTPGVENGILQVWIDGQLVDSRTGLLFRTNSSPQSINQQSISTFMGGNDASFAPNRTQHMWMDNFFVWRYSQEYLNANPNVARGFNLQSGNSKLYTPLDDRPQQEIKVSKITKEITPANSGTIVYEKGNDNSSNGTIVALRAIPNPGFRFMGWEVSGLNQQIGNTELIEFTKPDNDVTLRAVFEPISTSSNSLLDGLRVYYEMNQNQNNVLIDSHNGHNGINRGNVQLVNGYRDNGLQYNGRSSISEVPHADLLNLYTQFTIAVDIYRTGNGQSGTSILIGKEHPENRFSQVYSIGITPENRLRIRTRSNGNERNFETNATIPARTWQRVIVTYQAGKGYEVYLNKMEKESSPILNGSIQNSSGPLFIGANSDLDGGAASQDRRFEGVLDNVAIWNRALTFEQIKELIEKRLTYPDFGANNEESKSLNTKVYPEGSGSVRVTIGN